MKLNIFERMVSAAWISTIIVGCLLSALGAFLGGGVPPQFSEFFGRCNESEQPASSHPGKSAAAAQYAIIHGGIPATFAAGCFWGTEYFFKDEFGPKSKGVLTFHSVGYMAGELEGQNPTGRALTTNPGYGAVCTGTTGMAEVLHLVYNPKLVTYEELCLFFFRMHNPTTYRYQGHDEGIQYRSAIMVHNEEQRRIATSIISAFNPSNSDIVKVGSVSISPEDRQKFYEVFGENQRIVTTVEPATAFFDAEEYHQDYLETNPDGDCNHRIYW
jgi:peptide-methionine (S)-S-oxide reductase